MEGKKKSGQRLQGEGLERSGVCSVYEETGQGVRLRNSLQWLSQRHVDHHVLPPSLFPSLPLSLPTLTPLSARCLSLPPLPPPCIVSVCRVLSEFCSLHLSPLQSHAGPGLCLPGSCQERWSGREGKSRSSLSIETCWLVVLHFTCFGCQIRAAF